MNCQLCQKELDPYREGILPEGIKAQVETHLRDCKACAESDQLLRLADKVVEEEKRLQSNPFLITRIMSGIEELEQSRESYQPIPVFYKVFNSVMIGVSVAAAIFIGVVVGDNYSPVHPNNNLPIEMTYMNDAALESVEMFSQL